jgi:hypothetical protein
MTSSLGLIGNDGSREAGRREGLDRYLEASFLEDQFKTNSCFTLTGGLRLTQFPGAVTENPANPPIGAAIRIPRLNQVRRGFFGTYYQARHCPLSEGPCSTLP